MYALSLVGQPVKLAVLNSYQAAPYSTGTAGTSSENAFCSAFSAVCSSAGLVAFSNAAIAASAVALLYWLKSAAAVEPFGADSDESRMNCSRWNGVVPWPQWIAAS